MKNERTVRYTLDNLPAGRIDRQRVQGMSEEEVRRIALSDPDNPPATDEELAEGELVFPGDRGKTPELARAFVASMLKEIPDQNRESAEREVWQMLERVYKNAGTEPPDWLKRAG